MKESEHFGKMEENSDMVTDYAILRKKKLEECGKNLKGYPDLIARSFEAAESAKKDNRPKPNTDDSVVGEGETDVVAIKKDNRYLKVLQYNILADALATPDDNFEKVPPECLTWKFRINRTIEQILILNADIICLEEVDHFEDVFKPLFDELGFDGLFHPKKESPCLRNPNNNGPDGVALFYRRHKLSLVEARTKYLENIEKQESNQPALLCILRDEVNEKNICFAVTHFKAKKGFEELRSVQAKSLLKHVEELKKDVDSESAIIICGDFNGVPSEKFYEVMENYNGKSLQSAYKEAVGEEPSFTTWKIRQNLVTKHTIDYIWFSHDTFSVVSYLKLPEEGDVPEYGFPSFTSPSDHLALCCNFAMKQ